MLVDPGTESPANGYAGVCVRLPSGRTISASYPASRTAATPSSPAASNPVAKASANVRSGPETVADNAALAGTPVGASSTRAPRS